MVTVILIGITYFGYRFQMNQKGYAHIPVMLLILLGVLVLIAIGITVSRFGSQGRTSQKYKTK